MTTDTLHPLAAEYLQRLRRAGGGLPPGRLRELLAEIEGHLSEAIDPNASDAQALTVLDKLGEPEAIIAAEMPHPDELPDRRGAREWRIGWSLCGIRVRASCSRAPARPPGAGSGCEPFVRLPRSQRNGTGLGLAIVRRTIESHGGTITCDPSRRAAPDSRYDYQPTPNGRARP